MASNTCLFIKPHTNIAEALVQQARDFKRFVKPAIAGAGLTLSDSAEEGTVVRTISTELVKRIYETDIIVVDANCYEKEGWYKLSPYLYYFIGLRHAIGNRTILIASSIAHLEASLQRHHTLLYSPDDPLEFHDAFKKVIQAIQSGDDNISDNPFQEYRTQKDMAEQLARTKAEAMEKASQVEKLTREQSAGKQAPQKINFRRVN